MKATTNSGRRHSCPHGGALFSKKKNSLNYAVKRRENAPKKTRQLSRDNVIGGPWPIHDVRRKFTFWYSLVSHERLCIFDIVALSSGLNKSPQMRDHSSVVTYNKVHG